MKDSFEYPITNTEYSISRDYQLYHSVMDIGYWMFPLSYNSRNSIIKNQKFDLQNRLVKFAILIMEIVEMLPEDYTGKHFKNQLVPAFLYGETQAAESRKDFVHKMKIGLKELRESYIALIIIKEKPLLERKKAKQTLVECDELISIFFTNIDTAKRNMKKKTIQ